MLQTIQSSSFSLDTNVHQLIKNSLTSESTQSDGIASVCLPSASQLSRWINPPTQCCHLSPLPQPRGGSLTHFGQRGRYVCSFPKAMSPHRGRQGLNRRAVCSSTVSFDFTLTHSWKGKCAFVCVCVCVRTLLQICSTYLCNGLILVLYWVWTITLWFPNFRAATIHSLH